MKKIMLVFTFLLFHFSTIGQVVKPFNLKDFEGKKIVSLFKTSVEMRGNYPDVNGAPTNQYHTINRSISIQKNNGNTSIQKMLHRVTVGSENMVTLERDEFDTEKKFDRNAMASMVYGQYDKVVNKPFKMIYDSQGRRIDTLTNFKDNNFYFERAWSDYMLPALQDDFNGFFQMSLPTETEWKVGQTWEQKIIKKSGMVTKNENIINTYTVKSIDESTIVLELKGVNIPEQVMYKRTDGYVNNTLKDNNTTVTQKTNYTIEQKSTYEGTIKLNVKNNLILKMEVISNSFKRVKTNGSPATGPETAYIVTIENTLEDLK